MFLKRKLVVVGVVLYLLRVHSLIISGDRSGIWTLAGCLLLGTESFLLGCSSEEGKLETKDLILEEKESVEGGDESDESCFFDFFDCFFDSETIDFGFVDV